MRLVSLARACSTAALMIVVPIVGARAQSTADVFHEAESKYMFGFLDGADIGNEGEKAFEYEATGSFQKRGGRYMALEHEFEFEHVPTQNFALRAERARADACDQRRRRSRRPQLNAIQRRLCQAALSHHRPRPGLAVRLDGIGGAGMVARRWHRRHPGAGLQFDVQDRRRHRADHQPALCRDQSDVRAGSRQARRHRHVGAQLVGQHRPWARLPCHADRRRRRCRRIRSRP